MSKEEVHTQYHILFLKQNHRKNWGELIEKLLTKMGIEAEKVTKTRIFSLYSLFNSDNLTDELDLIEKDKVVAKLFKKGEFVDLHIKKRKRWIELNNIPLNAIKFSER